MQKNNKQTSGKTWGMGGSSKQFKVSKIPSSNINQRGRPEILDKKFSKKAVDKSSNNIIPKKSLGQNFLTNADICEKIVALPNLIEGDLVCEIGPGQMALTNFLLQKTQNLIIIEKDIECYNLVLAHFTASNYVVRLQEAFVCATKNNQNILLLNADALQIDVQNIIATFNASFNTSFKELKIVANLPYNIATLLVYKWCELDLPFLQSLTIMIQKEVAERITAKTNTKSYGKLSVLCQLLFACKMAFDVSAANFYPAPKVTSSLIVMQKNADSILKFDNVIPFAKFLTIAFAKKRKTLSNVFKGTNININPSLAQKRIEDLHPTQILQMFVG